MTKLELDRKQTRNVVVLLPLGLATLACLASLGHMLANDQTRSSALEWARYFELTVLQWYYWAGVTPLIVRLGIRVPIWKGSVWRALFVHLGAAVLASFAITSVLVLTETYLINHYFGSCLVSSILNFYFTYSLFTDLFIYLGILGVGQAFQYAMQLREREVESMELRAQLDRAYAIALQSQMQPHFVFNALHATGGLIRSGRSQEALKMVVGIGNLLRNILQRRELLEVCLREEVGFLEEYLGIQRMRFGDRLRTQIVAGEGVMNAFVPTFILQGLVENAIEHGIERASGAGSVEVKAWREDERLIVTVSNDGPPIAADWMSNGGTGLNNARSRLQRMFGANQKLDIVNVSGGVRATVSIPWRLAAS